MEGEVAEMDIIIAAILHDGKRWKDCGGVCGTRQSDD